MKIFKYKNGMFELNGKGYIMGIVNVTPDSFFDGGEYYDSSKAIEHCNLLKKQGADIIDLGAMSTRPGSEPITPKEEIKRLAPVLDELKNDDSVVISVDTVNYETADYVLSNGANIINDVSGYFNEDMASVVKKHDAGWVVTHTGNVPSGSIVDYPNGVVNDVNNFFNMMIEKCNQYGIDKKCICLDPGFGFAKTTEDNVELLKKLDMIIKDDYAFLTALSRKRFIGALTGTDSVENRLVGTIAADMIALMKGTDFIRVHDVSEAKQQVLIYNSIKDNDIYG